MKRKITEEQFEELDDLRGWDYSGYANRLRELTGIIAVSYTTCAYYDEYGNFIATDEEALAEVLYRADVEVEDDA